jgi:hypothetical protein
MEERREEITITKRRNRRCLLLLHLSFQSDLRPR